MEKSTCPRGPPEAIATLSRGHARGMEAEVMNEAILRPLVFLGVLVVMLIAEGLMPHHHDPMRSARRWGNSLLFLTGMVLGRLIAPMGALGIAAFVNAKGWGILPHLPFETRMDLRWVASSRLSL